MLKNRAITFTETAHKLILIIPSDRKGRIMFMHLSLTERALIEKYLAQGLNFSQIAKRLGRSRTTISREVKNRRHFMQPGDTHDVCIHFQTCRKHHVRTEGECFYCRDECKRCHKYACFKHCKEFVSMHCNKLDRHPYICVGCKSSKGCKKNRAYYNANKAYNAYMQDLSVSRRGLHTSQERLDEIEAIIYPLIMKGQSINHILAEHGDEIGLSESTLYNYIDCNAFNIRNIDLPKKVRYRPRRKQRSYKSDYHCRIGRSYEDFLAFMEDNPNTPYVEMDTVKGSRSSMKKTLLTMIFQDTGFMLIFLMNDGTAASVEEVFDMLTNVLGLKLFQELFPVILTDNGSEFKRVDQLEYAKGGQRRTRIFYCDPQASWQKPHVEKNHTLIRRILPKGTSFRFLTDEDVKQITRHINSVAKGVRDNRTSFDLMEKETHKKLLSALDLTPVPHDDVILRPSLLKRNF